MAELLLDDLLNRLNAASFDDMESGEDRAIIKLEDARAIIRRHYEGRPAVEGKPLELQTRDELLAFIRLRSDTQSDARIYLLSAQETILNAINSYSEKELGGWELSLVRRHLDKAIAAMEDARKGAIESADTSGAESSAATPSSANPRDCMGCGLSARGGVHHCDSDISDTTSGDCAGGKRAEDALDRKDGGGFGVSCPGFAQETSSACGLLNPDMPTPSSAMHWQPIETLSSDENYHLYRERVLFAFADGSFHTGYYDGVYGEPKKKRYCDHPHDSDPTYWMLPTPPSAA